jgi:RNA polymerase-binding transcription factor DksA
MAQKPKSSRKSKKAAKPASPKKKAAIKPKTARVAKRVGAKPKASSKASFKASPKASSKLSPKAVKLKVKPIPHPANGADEGREPQRPPIRLPRDAKTRAFFDRQKRRLLDLRDHFLDQMQSVAQDSLRSRAENNEASAVGQHQADAGSDAYEKDFALSLLSQEQDAIYEIEEALKRIETGAYGVCEMSNKHIPHARLEAIPFARFTVECQQQLEKENRGRRRWDTAPQFMDSAEAFADEEEESSEDDDKKKEKD